MKAQEQEVVPDASADASRMDITQHTACTGSSAIVPSRAYQERRWGRSYRTPGPRHTKAWVCQTERVYFSASQTSSKRRFIQWLGCGV